MINCCVFGCTNQTKKGGVSFHRFPIDPVLRKQWLIAIRRDNFSSTADKKICDRHFKDSDFMRNYGQRRLKPDAVPSIFNYPEQMKKEEDHDEVKPKLDTLIKNCSSFEVDTTLTTSIDIPFEQVEVKSEQISEEGEEKPNILDPCLLATSSCQMDTTSDTVKHFEINTGGPNYFEDFKLEDLKTDEARRVFTLANIWIKKQYATIKALKAKERSHLAKIKSLQDLIQQQKQKNDARQDLQQPKQNDVGQDLLQNLTDTDMDPELLVSKCKRYCSVPGCKTYKSKDVSVHLFPSDKQLCTKWKECLKIRKPISKHMAVCCKHFREQDFSIATLNPKLRRLKKGVIPSQNLPKTILNGCNKIKQSQGKIYVLQMRSKLESIVSSASGIHGFVP